MMKFDLQLMRIELKDLMHLFSCWCSGVAGNVISHKIKFISMSEFTITF